MTQMSLSNPIERPAPLQTLVPPKRYRVGEIARHMGLTRQTIHNYTAMGLIRESEWTPGGHRLYDETVFYRLSQIGLMKESKTMMEILAELEPGSPAGGFAAS